jgi:hypothetical protein
MIENAVAQNFLNAFNSAIVTIANDAANSLFNNIPTSVYFPQYQLDVSLKGGFDTFPLGALNGNLVLYAVGNSSLHFISTINQSINQFKINLLSEWIELNPYVFVFSVETYERNVFSGRWNETTSTV